LLQGRVRSFQLRGVPWYGATALRIPIAMAVLFWIVVLLGLALTGVILPVLYFGFWALFSVLLIVLVVWVGLRFLGFVLRPFAFLASDIFGWIRGSDHPKPTDPYYPHYIDWGNRVGEFAHYKEWVDARNELDARRAADASREAAFRRVAQRERREADIRKRMETRRQR